MVPETSSIDTKRKVLSLVKEENQVELDQVIDDLSAKEIIHLLGHLSRNDQMSLFNLLSPEEAAEVIDEIPDTQAVGIIEEMLPAHAAAILNKMESDEQADLIMELGEEDAQAILSEMHPKDAENVRKLLNYDADTAGGMMRTEFFAFFEHQTVQAVTDDMRRNAKKYKDFSLKYIFVKAANNKLNGVLQIQDLLLGQMESTLSEISIKKIFWVDHHASLDVLIDFFRDHDFFGVPVVNGDFELIGVVLRKDVLQAENERSVLEHLESQGILGGDELRTMPLLIRAKRRLSWLSVNIILNVIAASVIAFHQDTLTSVIALAVFLPIISDMSGCTGNQAVAVSMRELSIGIISPREVLRVLWQEVSLGFINGIVLGTLIGIAAYIWKGNIYFGFVVGSALALNTLLAVSLGGTIPLLLKGIKVDPALASGPILTTITDMVGFFLTLTFAALALSQLAGL